MHESIFSRLVSIRDQVSKVIDDVRNQDPVEPTDSEAYGQRWINTTMLVTNPLLIEWLREAGLSSYETELLSEETLVGSTVRDRIINGLRIGIQLAVFRMRHDPTENGELISAWASDREVEVSDDWDVISKGDMVFLVYMEERAKLFEAEAQEDKRRALNPGLHRDDAASIERKAVFLEGKAKGIRYTSAIIAEAVIRARGDKTEGSI